MSVRGVVTVAILVGIGVCFFNGCESEKPNKYSTWTRETNRGHDYVVRTKDGIDQVLHDPDCSCHKVRRGY